MNEPAARSLVQAAAWRSHLTESGVETSAAFEAWLSADPDHEAAWRQVQTAWDLFGEQAVSPELIELRRAALAEARSAGQRRWHSGGTLRGRVFRAAAAAAVVATVGALLVWNAYRPDVYKTIVGERRVVTLSDGSQVALDSNSEVRVRYSARARDVTLATGQARFDVHRDVERPFSVVAGGQKVVATGTAFNVDLLDSNLFVTLIEGRVVVLPTNDAAERAAGPLPSATAVPESEAAALVVAGRGIELTAGEQLILGPSAPPSVIAVDIAQATAWQNGRLIFDNEALRSVITRVNRYGGQPLRIADQATAELRISGVFNAGDVSGFLATITNYLPVRAVRSNDGAIELRHR